MNEKAMVSDALVGVNGELKMFGEMIPQTENKELKQFLQRCVQPDTNREMRTPSPLAISVHLIVA